VQSPAKTEQSDLKAAIGRTTEAVASAAMAARPATNSSHRATEMIVETAAEIVPPIETIAATVTIVVIGTPTSAIVAMAGGIDVDVDADPGRKAVAAAPVARPAPELEVAAAGTSRASEISRSSRRRRSSRFR
jgi:hypothetical protein